MRSMILCASLMLVAMVAALCSGAAAGQVTAGAARVSITPAPRVMAYTLGGYGDRGRFTHPATGVHDPCFARVIVLSDGGRKCALVSLDLCYIPANVRDAVAQRVARAGLRPDQLFLAATHTHSAPEPLLLHSGNTGAHGVLPTFKPELLAWVADHISQAILEADRKRRPALIGSGQAQHIGLNRNRRGEGLTDDEMTVLRVDGADGKPIATVVDYAAHPTFFGASMLEVSGDWPGAMERKLEAEHPDMVALFLNGAEGDAAARGAEEGTAEQRVGAYAGLVARKAEALLSSIEPRADVAVACWSHTVDLPPVSPHPFFLLAATQFGAAPSQAREFVAQLMPRKCELTFLRAGGVLLVGFPGEPSAPIGLKAKALARVAGAAHPAVVALTNGWLGYLLTPEQYRAGKYEATMSFYGDQLGPVLLEGVRAGLERPVPR